MFFFSSPLWLIISREDALHQPKRLLILAVGNGRRRNDWGSPQTLFTSWQRRLALCGCSSKHFHLAHLWSSCLIFLWRQKSFKPHSILGQHIYWRLALQYLREINTAPWFMNPCHPPTGLVGGPEPLSPCCCLLTQWDLGIKRRTHDPHYHPHHHHHHLRYTQQHWTEGDRSDNTSGHVLHMVKRTNLRRSSSLGRVQGRWRGKKKKTPDIWTCAFIFQVDLELCKQVCHCRICDIRLLFWLPTISLATPTVHDRGGRAAARLSNSLVFVYSEQSMAGHLYYRNNKSAGTRFSASMCRFLSWQEALKSSNFFAIKSS